MDGASGCQSVLLMKFVQPLTVTLPSLDDAGLPSSGSFPACPYRLPANARPGWELRLFPVDGHESGNPWNLGSKVLLLSVSGGDTPHRDIGTSRKYFVSPQTPYLRAGGLAGSALPHGIYQDERSDLHLAFRCHLLPLAHLFLVLYELFGEGGPSCESSVAS